MKRIYKRIFYVAHVIIKNVKSLNFEKNTISNRQYFNTALKVCSFQLKNVQLKQLTHPTFQSLLRIWWTTLLTQTTRKVLGCFTKELYN